jgi:hypothetical protein
MSCCCNGVLLSWQPAAATAQWEELIYDCQHAQTVGFVQMQGMVAPHMADPHWGAHASAMLNGTMFRQPPGGGHDDKCVSLQEHTSFMAHSSQSLCWQATVQCHGALARRIERPTEVAELADHSLWLSATRLLP